MVEHGGVGHGSVGARAILLSDAFFAGQSYLTLAKCAGPPIPTQTLVTDMYNEVKAEAERDNAKWGNTGTPEKGHTCVGGWRVVGS